MLINSHGDNFHGLRCHVRRHVHILYKLKQLVKRAIDFSQENLNATYNLLGAKALVDSFQCEVSFFDCSVW